MKSFRSILSLFLFVWFSYGQHDLLVTVEKTVVISDYFNYMDSLVRHYDSLIPQKIKEHHIVRHNPEIINILADTDYYRMMARDSFVYDQKNMIVLNKGFLLRIPGSHAISELDSIFKETSIDINIPEFKLRILQNDKIIEEFPIRVGQNKKKYLAMGDRITDLRTKIGTGEIVSHNRDPDFYNPVDGKQFYLTRRDDNKVTKMPQIPWIETRINGIHNGQMIHPTTNPETLGKAYSNGCIGTTEADAWIIYYNAPIGTRISIRYDLKINDHNGKKMELSDIYGLKPKF